MFTQRSNMPSSVTVDGTKDHLPEHHAISRSIPPDNRSRANSPDQSTASDTSTDESSRTEFVEESTIRHSGEPEKQEPRKAKAKASFLTLPPELRHAIYSLALPTRHLSTGIFVDYEQIQSPQTIPPLFLVSRRLYSESSNVFYGKAILDLPVPQLSPDLHDWATGVLPLSSQQRERSLTFLPQRLKDQVKKAHLFNNEAGIFPTPVAYEALLSWLSRNTGVREIVISKALMFRACKRRSIRETEASALLSLSSPPGESSTVPFRTLKIFSRNDREFWEGRGMGAGRGTIVAEQAPSLRMFICLKDSKTTALICDPRGTPRVNRQNASEVERVHGSMVGDLMDGFRARDPELRDEMVQRTEKDGRWLFQVVFVI
jgi:hypothetical protein